MMSGRWRTPLVILICATAILLLSFGVRQTYGLFLAPITTAHGWTIEVFSFAMALQTLIWGLSQPVWGGIADRYGAGRVVGAGALLYGGGLWLMAESTSEAGIVLSTGLLTGVGMSAMSFPILLAVVGRAVAPERRSLYLGLASAGGSSGQLLVVPFAQYFISTQGYVATLVILAVIVALIAPLAAAVAGKQKSDAPPGHDIPIGAALREASGHSGYLLLVTGFFVCGFQTMFIGAHLPNYLVQAGASPALGATALALIGLFNMIGCFVWGALGGRYSKKYLLAALYMVRAAAMAAFILLPMTEIGVILFASVIGFLFLATVPLTSGLVAQIFGTQYMAMLYGFAFLSHQIGSFLGIWMGGRLYVAYQSYDPIWWVAIALGFVAAALHWPIDERTVPRLAARSPAAAR